MRLGVLGGTFNPVHFGHLRAAEEVRQRLDLDRVLFVPSGSPPLKDEGLASVDSRFRMVELAIASNPFFEASDIELGRSGPSYTIDTVSELSARYSEHDIQFILGSDAFADLPMWKDPVGLVSSVDFAVVGRPPEAFSTLEGSPFLKFPDGWLSALEPGGEGTLSLPTSGGRTVTLVAMPLLEISATRIRGMVRKGESIRYLLPEDVELFIMSHGLYRNG